MNNNFNNYNGYNNNGYDQNGYNNGYNQNGYNGGFGANGQMYQQNPYNPNPYAQNGAALSLSDYTRKVYGWMFIGLAITFGIGLFIALNQDLAIAFLERYINVYLLVVGIEVALVFVLGLFITKLPPTVCTVLFLAYSAVNGLTITPALIAYDMSSVIAAFAVTGCIFGAMSVYGMVTKRDLSGLGPILLFGLIGLLIYSVIAMLFGIPMSDLITSLIGIAIFIGFTAYDTQKIKRYYASMQYDSVLLQKGAIVAALDLYLDFINLFLYILRLFASRRN